MEPVVGDAVRFRESGSQRRGTVRDVFMAGKASGAGVWRLRRRVRILFESDGKRWETNRDVGDVRVDDQPSLFEQENA